MDNETIDNELADRFDTLVSDMEDAGIDPVEWCMAFIGSALEVSGYDSHDIEYDGMDGFPKLVTLSIQDNISHVIN